VTDTKGADLEQVRSILERNQPELLSKPGVVGAGIGARGNGSDGYVIVVYVTSARDIPPEPAAIEGVALRFEVTGPFVLFSCEDVT
jgi:hypothetical protein